jgi:hypothetical protein
MGRRPQGGGHGSARDHKGGEHEQRDSAGHVPVVGLSG